MLELADKAIKIVVVVSVFLTLKKLRDMEDVFKNKLLEMNIVMSGRKIVLEGINSRADIEDAKISEGEDTATNTSNKKHRMENIFKRTEHQQANSNARGFTGCVLSTVMPSQLNMISDWRQTAQPRCPLGDCYCGA